MKNQKQLKQKNEIVVMKTLSKPIKNKQKSFKAGMFFLAKRNKKKNKLQNIVKATRITRLAELQIAGVEENYTENFIQQKIYDMASKPTKQRQTEKIGRQFFRNRKKTYGSDSKPGPLPSQEYLLLPGKICRICLEI